MHLEDIHNEVIITQSFRFFKAFLKLFIFFVKNVGMLWSEEGGTVGFETAVTDKLRGNDKLSLSPHPSVLRTATVPRDHGGRL